MFSGEKGLTSCCKSLMQVNDYHHTLNLVIADYNHVLRTRQNEDSQLLEFKSPNNQAQHEKGVECWASPPMGKTLTARLSWWSIPLWEQLYPSTSPGSLIATGGSKTSRDNAYKLWLQYPLKDNFFMC